MSKVLKNIMFELKSEYNEIPSLQPVKKTTTLLCCKINLFDASAHIKLRLGLGIENSNYEFTLFVLRSKVKDEDMFPFEISILTRHNLRKVIYNFSDFDSELISNQEMTIRFAWRDKENTPLEFTMEFIYFFDFQLVKRIVKMKRKHCLDNKVKHMLLNRNLKEEIEEENSRNPIVTVNYDIIRNYSVKTKEAKKKNGWFKSDLNRMSSFNSVYSSSGEEEQPEYYTPLVRIRTEEWTAPQILSWCQQIPYFHLPEKKFISLYTLLEEDNLLIQFEDFLRQTERPFLILREQVSRDKNKSVIPSITRIVENEAVCRRLRVHFKILQFMNGRYNPSLYVVLRKRLRHIKTIQLEKIDNFLESIEGKVVFNYIYSWSSEALSRKLAFNFLFGVTMEEYQVELERMFVEYNRRNKKLSNLATLEKFSEEIGFKLENLSLDVLFQKRIWEIEREVNQLMTEENVLTTDLREDSENIRARVRNLYETKIKTWNSTISKIRNDDPDRQTKISTLESCRDRVVKKMAQEIDIMIEKVRKKRLVLRNEMKRMTRVKMGMKKNRKKKVFDEGWVFYNLRTGPYFKTLDELIDRKIKSILEPKASHPLKRNIFNQIIKIPQEEEEEEEEEGESESESDSEEKEIIKMNNKEEKDKPEEEGGMNTISISAKLVVSRRLNLPIYNIFKYSLKVYKSLSLFNNLDYIRMGFSHSGIIFCNVGIQWFQNELVCVEDIRGLSKYMRKYEDLACVDAQSLEFLTSEDFLDFVKTLSIEIIDANTNYRYDTFGARTLQPRYIMNCQEFALRMLRSVGLPDQFYPEVDKFLRDLSQMHNKKQKEEEKKSKKKNKKKKETEEQGEKEKLGSSEPPPAVKKKCYRFCRIPKGFPENLADDRNLEEGILRQYNKKNNKKKQKRKRNSSLLLSNSPSSGNLDKNLEKEFFWTHKQLDDFVHRCMESDDRFEMNFPGLFHLLKAFDRAFWVMKLHRAEEEESNMPRLDEEGKCDCPFFLENKGSMNVQEELIIESVSEESSEEDFLRDDDEMDFVLMDREEEEEEEGEGETGMDQDEEEKIDGQGIFPGSTTKKGF